jgi:hypothetical protein
VTTFYRKICELHDDFNKNALRAFILRDCIEIPVNMFTTIELRILGFMWDNSPLQLGNFKIQYSQKPPISIATFKKQKNEF